MNDEEYRVYEIPLPGDIYGAVRVDADGFASIYINEALAPQAKRETLDHELGHLRHHDHTNGETIFLVERNTLA